MAQVTAVLPAYNAAKYIEAALDSVRDQTRPVDEIIVADDASTDDTVVVVERWSAQNRPVTVVRLAENGGAGAARNAGVNAASHDIIALLDSDDQWHLNMVELLAAHLEQDPELAAAFGFREITDDSGPTGRYQGQHRLEALLQERGGKDHLILTSKDAFLLNLRSGVTSCSAAAVRKYKAVAAGLFDANLRMSEDREFFLRLSRQGPFAFVAQPVGSYRLHDGNTTHARHVLKVARNALQVPVKLQRIADELGLDSEERHRLNACLDESAEGLLYAASTAGLREYSDARRRTRDAGASVAAWRPTYAVRAMWHSLRPTGDHQHSLPTNN